MPSEYFLFLFPVIHSRLCELWRHSVWAIVGAYHHYQLEDLSSAAAFAAAATAKAISL